MDEPEEVCLECHIKSGEDCVTLCSAHAGLFDLLQKNDLLKEHLSAAEEAFDKYGSLQDKHNSLVVKATALLRASSENTVKEMLDTNIDFLGLVGRLVELEEAISSVPRVWGEK